MSHNNTIPLFKSGESPHTIRIGLKWEPRTEKNIIRKAYYARGALVSNILYIPMWAISLLVGVLIFILTLGKNKNYLPGSLIKNTLDYDLIYDTNPERAEKIDQENTREDTTEYDIDLYCIARRKSDGEMIKVGPEDKNMFSPDETIFHSGEDHTGQGVYDDETIHLDLEHAAQTYSEFFIIIRSDCNYDFASLDNKPKIRVIHSKTEREICTHIINTLAPDAKNKYTYIYAKISESNNIWTLQSIEKFGDFDDNLQEYQ